MRQVVLGNTLSELTVCGEKTAKKVFKMTGRAGKGENLDTIREEDEGDATHVQEQTLCVGGHRLYDKKEIEPGIRHGITIYTHSRIIDNRS